MDSQELVLEQKQVKALSVDSRVKILKLLDKRNYTLSELSEKLALSKPAIKEHLVILESADLIKKLPSSNKWIYYSLTKSGKKIIQPEGVRVLFMFVFSLFATCVIGFYLIFVQSNQYLQNDYGNAMDRTMKSVVIAESSDAMPMLTNSAPQVTTEITKDFSYDWLLFVALLLITIFLFLLYLHKRRKV